MEMHVIYFNIKSKLKFSENSRLTHVPGAPKDLLVPSTVSCITASRLSNEAPSLRLSAKLCWILFLHHNNHSDNILHHIMTETHNGSFLKLPLEFSILGWMTSTSGLVSVLCLWLLGRFKEFLKP